MATTRRLDTPVESAHRFGRLPRFSGDDFGRFSEDIARFFGTARYLAIQTVLVLIWITLNLLPVLKVVRWDPYPFILLNLAFSTQAAYAAPLILLAQNRQADRDRVALEQDRAQIAQQKADTDYISREIASVRVAQRDSASRDYIRAEVAAQLADLRDAIREDLRTELAPLTTAT